MQEITFGGRELPPPLGMSIKQIEWEEEHNRICRQHRGKPSYWLEKTDEGKEVARKLRSLVSKIRNFDPDDHDDYDDDAEYKHYLKRNGKVCRRCGKP